LTGGTVGQFGQPAQREEGVDSVYSRILVPIDGSKDSEQVLPLVQLLAAGLDSCVQLTRVIEPVSDDPGDPAYRSYLDQIMENLNLEAESNLTDLATRLEEQGTEVSTSVLKGDPVTSIKAQAEEKPSTLIVMCSHGRSGDKRWWLGSTTDKVLHATSNPLLIFRAEEQQPSAGQAGVTVCIVPLDGSSRAEGVLPHVVGLARALPLKVLLTRALPEMKSHFWELFPDAYQENRDSQALLYLEEARQNLLQQGVSDVDVCLLHGNPASVINDLAGNQPNSLVAMSTSGLGGAGIYRWTVGTVTQRVVGSSRAPVLVIHTEEL